MAAAGYALMRGVHIRADFIYRNWSPKTQATVDATMYLAFYFPAMLFFFWTSLDSFMDAINPRNGYAVNGWERLSDTAWAPLAAPARLAMPLGAFLLLLQGFPRAVPRFPPDGQGAGTDVPPHPALLLPRASQLSSPVCSLKRSAGWRLVVRSIIGSTGLTSIDKPTIGLLMLGAMLFSIFVGFPISFTLIFLAFVFGSWGAGSALTFFLHDPADQRGDAG